MGMKSVKKLPLDKERLMTALKIRNLSLRDLDKDDKFDGSTKTIGRALRSGFISHTMMCNLAEYLNVDPYYLSGVGGGAVYIDSYETFLEKKQKIKEELNTKYGKNTQPSNKLFYVGLMFGEDGICWPTDSFTDKELEVIDKFLKEFNEHASGKMIDCVAVLDNDEEEEEE